MTDEIVYEIIYSWRQSVSGREIAELAPFDTGHPVVDRWDQISSRSLGWVTARTSGGLLVGFVNVAWDGGFHAFLVDTMTRGTHRHEGIGTEVVRIATEHARAAGCEWLHVDFEPHLTDFYLGSCGFRPTAAGLIHLLSEDR